MFGVTWPLAALVAPDSDKAAISEDVAGLPLWILALKFAEPGFISRLAIVQCVRGLPALTWRAGFGTDGG